MGTVIQNNFVQGAQEFHLLGAPHPLMVVTGHVWESGTMSIDDAAENIRTGWKVFGWAGPGTMPSNWALGRCRALGRDASGNLHAGEDSTVQWGTGTANATLPVNCSMLIQKRTGLAGRKYRGRMFYPTIGTGEEQVTPAGYLEAASVTAYQAMFNALLTAWDTIGLDLVILHSGVESPTPVTSLVVQPLLATQRTRMR